MSISHRSSVQSTESARHRRPATACTTCRDRRVKCDRVRPICSQCKKGDRGCGYQKHVASTVEFVSDPYSTLAGTSPGDAPSDTWDSVVKQQLDFVRNSTTPMNRARSDVPFWMLVEAEEAHGTFSTWASETQPVHSVISIGALGQPFVSTLTTMFPPQDMCQRFFDNFLLSIHPAIPICHVPTLGREYTEFWQNLSQDTPVESLVQILGVLYTGAASSTSVDDIAQSISLYSIYEEVFRLVDLSAFYPTKSSLQLLQGFVLLNTFRVCHFAPFSAFGFLPQAIRFGQSLRLHVDPEHGDPVQIDVRRRLWWHLVCLDVESTVASGLQGVIRSDGHNVKLPRIICDQEGLEDEVFSRSSCTASQALPMMLAMHGQRLWAQSMQKWSEALSDEEEVLHFKRSIEHLLELLGHSKEDEWPCTYLKMLIDRAYCMLGLRFWHLEQFKGTDCQSEVVRTARSFSERYLRLSTLSASLGLSWLVPGFIQPLHAVIILLMHLSGCSNPDTEGRTRDLVDRVMEVRQTWIFSGSVAPKGLRVLGSRPHLSNPRYHSLRALRSSMEQKLAWPTPKLRPLLKDNPMDAEVQQTVPATPSTTSLVDSHQHYQDQSNDTDFPSNTFLTADIGEFSQWDDWETIIAGTLLD